MRDARGAGGELGGDVADAGGRTQGLAAVGMGTGALVLHLLSLYFLSRVFVIVLVAGLLLLATGLWNLVTDRTLKTPENPIWWVAGHHVVSATAVLTGLYLAFWYY